MIKIDNKEFRNLEEQVQKNKEDIAKHYQATQLPLNLAGIEVLGETNGDPADDEKVGEKYGDAYVQIVDEDSAVLWIWTRANPDAGEPNDYWLDIPFTVVGKQGPEGKQGKQGETGQRGSQWYFFDRAPNPSDAQGKFINDVWFNWKTAKIWHLHGPEDNPIWVQEGTIMGATGKTGPAPVVGPNGNWFVDGIDTGNPSRGETGEQGQPGQRGPSGSVLIPKGIVTSIDQLPTYTTVPENSAYYYSTTGEPPFEVWGIVGNGWAKVGDVTTGTVVLVNNTVQDEWNADTKLDKVTSTGGRRVYAITGSGTQDVYTLRPDVAPSPNYQIVVRDSSGQVTVPATPTATTNAASKQYVDNKAVMYEHNVKVVAENSGDSFEVFERHYNHNSTPETNLNTGSTTVMSGYASITSDICPVISGQINTSSSGLTVTYIHMGQVETTSFDGGTWTVTDVVRAV